MKSGMGNKRYRDKIKIKRNIKNKIKIESEN